MTTQFLPGDKVRRISTGFLSADSLQHGGIYTVERAAGDKVWLLDDERKPHDGWDGYRDADRFELVSRAAPGWTHPKTPFEIAQEYFAKVDKGAAPVGRKDDTGKLDMTLLDDMPRAVKAVVEVMQWAVEKKKPKPYVRGSWLGVSADRYRAAIMRHNREAAEQAIGGDLDAVRYQRDKETNLLHIAHIACSAMMALENTLRELESKK